jgi:hypothetical protein
MKRSTIYRSLILFFTLLNLSLPAQAIIVCHDYTMYRVTGKDPRPKGSAGMQGSSVDALRKYLDKVLHYKSFSLTNAADKKTGNRAMVQRLLKPGDVIILRDDHSGYVNDKGLIDHFIMVEGTSTKDKKYDVSELPPHALLKGLKGGFFKNDTFDDFLGRLHNQAGLTVEVWRKP